MNIFEHAWDEILHVLGIAKAIAPIVAISDPNVAANISKAANAVAQVQPVVEAVKAAAGPGLTHEQTVTAVTHAVTTGAAIAAASGKLSTDKAQMVQSLAPIVEAAVLASNPIGTPAAQ